MEETAPREPEARAATEPAALSCLLASLNEVQQTIRAYDTKAQIMGVGFIFSVTMIANLLGNLDIERTFGIGYLLGGFLLLMGPLVLFGSVLYPSRRTAPEVKDGSTPIHHCFYVQPERNRGPDGLLKDIEAADWKAELVYEISRLSALRGLKRQRFVRAMFMAGTSFGIILLVNVLKMAGLA